MIARNVTISVIIPAPRENVWSELSNIEHHLDWMADAVALEFHSDQRQGVGTAFSCLTKIRPFRTTNEITIDQWVDGSLLGVMHGGVVTGTGEFSLESLENESTAITWTESLKFPWWMGGPLGSWCAKPIFHFIWKQNLNRLSQRITTTL